MKKKTIGSILAAVVLSIALVALTGGSSALADSLNSRGKKNDNNHGRPRYGRDFDNDSDEDRMYRPNNVNGYGNIHCDEFEYETEVEEQPRNNEIHFRRGGDDKKMSFSNDTKVFNGNWKDLEKKPTVRVKGRKCRDNPKPVCDSITIVRKNDR